MSTRHKYQFVTHNVLVYNNCQDCLISPCFQIPQPHQWGSRPPSWWTRACGIPNLPTKSSCQQKIPKIKKKVPPTCNLAYLTVWWRRMDREGVKDALALKNVHERQNCADGKRTLLSLRNLYLKLVKIVNNCSNIYLDPEEEWCKTSDMTKGCHPHLDLIQECPLSESHPQILSGLRGEDILGNNKRVLPECLGSPSKHLRTEGPSTNNKNTLYKHSEESSVSETSKSY